MKAKELEELIKLCRANGVTSIKTKEVELQLLEDSSINAAKTLPNYADNALEADEMSEDDLIDWSSAASNRG